MSIKFRTGDVVQHYKGNVYIILGKAIHSETLETCLLYSAYDPQSQEQSEHLWVRPEPMFYDMIQMNNIQVPRFKLL